MLDINRSLMAHLLYGCQCFVNLKVNVGCCGYGRQCFMPRESELNVGYGYQCFVRETPFHTINF